MWLERSGPETVAKIESAFETPKSEYYRFMGSMVTRMYYLFPQAKYRSTSGKRLAYAFYICCFLVGFTTFAIVPAFFAPDRFSQAIGMNWSDLHIVLKIYVFLLVSIASVIGIAVAWVVLVGTWHMGIEARGLQVELNITRAASNLGLRPYSRVILLTIFAYLLIYLITTSVFLFVELNVFVLTGLAIMLILPLVAFLGSQYGLHVAIQQSKARRLHKFSEEFDEEIQVWFRNDGPTPSSQTNTSLNEFVAAKESIESLPDWPVTVDSVMKLFSAVFGSNIWIILELGMVLNWRW